MKRMYCDLCGKEMDTRVEGFYSNSFNVTYKIDICRKCSDDLKEHVNQYLAEKKDSNRTSE